MGPVVSLPVVSLPDETNSRPMKHRTMCGVCALLEPYQGCCLKDSTVPAVPQFPARPSPTEPPIEPLPRQPRLFRAAHGGAGMRQRASAGVWGLDLLGFGMGLPFFLLLVLFF